MKSEIIWTQEHHYRDMVTLAEAQAEIDVIQNELNCAVETNGQLQDYCNELVEMLTYCSCAYPEDQEKKDALIAKHRGEKCTHCTDKAETTDANGKPSCFPCAYHSAM